MLNSALENSKQGGEKEKKGTGVEKWLVRNGGDSHIICAYGAGVRLHVTHILPGPVVRIVWTGHHYMILKIEEFA